MTATEPPIPLAEPPPQPVEPIAEADPAALEPSLAERLDRIEAAIAEHLTESRALSRDALRHAHGEATATRESAAFGGLRPLLNELLTLRDDLVRLIAHYATAGSADPRGVVENLDGLRAELDEVFARRGVVPIQTVGARFDRDTQRAVSVVPVSDPSADLTVVREVRTGFTTPGGLVRRTDVAITRYQPQPQVQERQ